MSDLPNRLLHDALILEATSHHLRRAAAEIERLTEVRAATIEECAQLVEGLSWKYPWSDQYATAIRALKEQK